MRKLLSVLLICFIAFNTVFAAETFLTRENIPIATTEAEALKTLGMLKGTEKGLELERNVTRAEAVTMISRVAGLAFDDIGYANPPFEDMVGHWAQDIVEKFFRAGFINGTSATTFTPDRTVTGKEFVKILLTVMGYENIGIENSYDKGIESGLLNDNFTKSVVHNNDALLRSDVARLCFAALSTKTGRDKILYKELVEKNLYKENDFEGVILIINDNPNNQNNVDGSQNFSDKFTAQLPKDKNYMFSPLSIKMAFALAANGATGQTQQEILDAVGIDNLDEFNQISKDMIEEYSKAEILKLNIANSIWINQSRTDQNFSNTYKNKIAEFYSGTADVVNNDNAVEKVNFWVNEKTNEKIPSIINNNEFWACLVNAIYFKGAWLSEFGEDSTTKADFTDKNGKISNIDFMNRTGWMQYSNNDDLQIIELPYKNRVDNYSDKYEYLGSEQYDFDVSMFILMSDNEIADAEKILNETELGNKYIKLSMPKFKIEFESNLNDIMENLGVNRAFKEIAEFQPMFDKDTMWITDVIHKTFISVDEKGTEATAVTAIGMAGSSLPPEPIEVKINKPFTFVIKDKNNGEILFMGEYMFAE